MTDAKLDPDQEKTILILRLILTELGLSQSDLAEITNRHHDAVRHWLDGKNHIPADAIEVLIRHFDLRPDFFENPIRGQTSNDNGPGPGFIQIQHGSYKSVHPFPDDKDQLKELLHYIIDRSVDLHETSDDPESHQ